ncbi:NUDIX hydrolase [Oceanobacillus sojae]|uniref:NUDIX hydrolase n=1 Tax=Oceanobacillus sojae TaxID=582851 RepID=UPI00158E6B37|nr:NUDIX domain-containing protein [Oceanobacillus sojae]MCT1901366.1 NUDIX domain-containing protein [Oceanobacillus sojae]
MQSSVVTDKIKKQVENYLSLYPEEKERLAPLIHQLNENNTDIFSRKSLPGHITASAIILKKSDPDYMLMMFHQNLKKWLQPDGHVDPGERPIESAIRELREETGMDGKVDAMNSLIPIDIDIHPIPANPKKEEGDHQHYDFRYIVTVDTEFIPENIENNRVDWVHVNDIDSPGLNAVIEKIERF